MNAYFGARSNVTHASRVTPTPYDGYTKALSFNLVPSGPNASIVTKPLPVGDEAFFYVQFYALAPTGI
jgi:hypothetical protein